jgi:hypothetical protein
MVSREVVLMPNQPGTLTVPLPLKISVAFSGEDNHLYVELRVEYDPDYKPTKNSPVPVRSGPLPPPYILPLPPVPFGYFEDENHIDRYVAEIKGDFLGALWSYVTRHIGMHLMDSFYLAAIKVGLAGEDFRNAIRKGHADAEANLLESRVGTSSAGRPVRWTQARLRREVLRAARALMRGGNPIPKLDTVAHKMRMSERGLSKLMERKGVSWREIKAELKTAT